VSLPGVDAARPVRRGSRGPVDEPAPTIAGLAMTGADGVGFSGLLTSRRRSILTLGPILKIGASNV
jgi:hypothetical protein